MAYNCPGNTRFRRFGLFIILPLLLTASRSQDVKNAAATGATQPDSNRSEIIEKINSGYRAEYSGQHKSVGRAFLYSLLLPGLGEAYSGNFGYTKFFLTVETAGWGVYLMNHLQVVSKTDDYKNFAIDHAGIIQAGKDRQYWIDIGKYDTIYEYNEQKRRERNVSAIYTENTQNLWRWDSKNNRLYYDWKRIQARELERSQIYLVGGLVLNHLLSAINSLRLARAHNRRSAGALSWDFRVSVNPYRQTALLNFSRSF